jgi:hypothetical protein
MAIGVEVGSITLFGTRIARSTLDLNEAVTPAAKSVSVASYGSIKLLATPRKAMIS